MKNKDDSVFELTTISSINLEGVTKIEFFDGEKIDPDYLFVPGKERLKNNFYRFLFGTPSDAILDLKTRRIKSIISSIGPQFKNPFNDKWYTKSGDYEIKSVSFFKFYYYGDGYNKSNSKSYVWTYLANFKPELIEKMKETILKKLGKINTKLYYFDNDDNQII